MVADITLFTALLPLLRSAFPNWEPEDIRRNFELAYQDPDVKLAIRSDSGKAAPILAEATKEFLIERMKTLRLKEENKRKLLE